MRRRAALAAGVGVLSVIVTVAGCSGSSGGDGTPSATATVTTTAPGATGAPVTGTPTGGGTPTGSGTTGGSGKTVGAGGGSAGSAAGPGLCTPTVMTFVVNRGDGAAGTGYFSVTATNASQQSCVTTGFPGVAFLDAAGKQVLQAGRDTAGTTVATITLAPGERATAVIAAVSAAADNSSCATYPAFLFTLPDNTDSTKLVRSTYACAVTVRPFVKGSTGT